MKLGNPGAVPSSQARPHRISTSSRRRRFAPIALQRARLAALGLLLWIPLLGTIPPPARAQVADANSIRGELRAGRFPDAERHARELLLATDRIHGPESIEVAEVLDLLAEALRRSGKGKNPEALRVCERSLSIKRRRLSPDDPSIATSLENLGALHLANGDLTDARAPLEQALDLRIRALGPTHADVARTLLFLGNLEFTAARDDTARALVERAIAIQDSVLPADDPARAQALEMLSGIHYERGEYREAFAVSERVLALRTRTLGLDHPSTASTLHNLGSLAAELGDLDEATRYLEQARAVMQRARLPEHPMVARTLASLASVRSSRGDYAGAMKLYREAVRIERKAFGPEHGDIAWHLMHAGRMELELGRDAAARKDLRAALRIQEQVLDANHPDFAWTLTALARADAAGGDVDLALDRCARAIAIQERVLGARHPDLAQTLAYSATFLAMKGDTARALESALRSSRIRAEHLRLTSSGLSERQALAYAGRGPTGLDVALSLVIHPGARGTPASVAQVWDGVVQTRTLVLDAMAARHRATLDDSAAAGAAGEALRGARQRLANLLVRGPQSDTPERYQALLRRARLEMERAERELGVETDESLALSTAPRRGIGDVFAAVPQGWGLVAYTSFGSGRSRKYVAFVHGASGVPLAVSIGDADRVDGLVRSWAGDVLSDRTDSGRSAARAEAAARRSGTKLREAIWDPVVAALGPAAGVLIVPEGAIHAVNFGALPAANGGYLVEEERLLHYVTSELDLVSRDGISPLGSGLLAFGGIDFGRADPAAGAGEPAPGSEAALGWGDDCLEFREVTFAPLPQSRLEVEEIARAWPEPGPTVLATGLDATEGAFKRSAPGKRVLHLATHGFFLNPTRCLDTEAKVRGIGGLESSVRPRRHRTFSQTSPLLLSGLALALANRRSEASPDEDDGILTAEEVASLDLRGVEWAVLSSCDTGVAAATRGEGVLGLRRAFRTAGVATLVISLWPVQDEAAREWMRELYRSKFERHESTAVAVRSATLQVLRGRRAQGQSTNPSFWAAFLAAGDWN